MFEVRRASARRREPLSVARAPPLAPTRVARPSAGPAEIPADSPDRHGRVRRRHLGVGHRDREKGAIQRRARVARRRSGVGGERSDAGARARPDAQFAIKKISRAFDDISDAKRMLRELKLLRQFDHENVINIVDILPPPSLCAADWLDVYIVSDLMETDLHRIIYSRQPLSLEHIQYFVYQARAVRAVSASASARAAASPLAKAADRRCAEMRRARAARALPSSRCCARSSTCTRRRCCTATSNRRTCSSTRIATSRSATSGSRAASRPTTRPRPS